MVNNGVETLETTLLQFEKPNRWVAPWLPIASLRPAQ